VGPAGDEGRPPPAVLAAVAGRSRVVVLAVAAVRIVRVVVLAVAAVRIVRAAVPAVAAVRIVRAAVPAEVAGRLVRAAARLPRASGVAPVTSVG
jgi:hypothetical protein